MDRLEFDTIEEDGPGLGSFKLTDKYKTNKSLIFRRTLNNKSIDTCLSYSKKPLY